MYFAPVLRTRSQAPARGVDRSFERFLTEAQRGLKVQQDEQSWTLTLDLPGIAREHLAVEVDGNVVTLKTVADAPRSYQAAYELPEAIDADATSARLELGVLTLVLGKKKPVVTTRTIEVR